MTQAAAERKAVVDPAIYSKDYFLTDNEGWREYLNGLDNHMHPKFARALEVGNPSKEDAVLDIGCGRGELFYYCAQRGARVIGLDYSQAAVDIARQTIERLPPSSRQHARAGVGDPCAYLFNEKFSLVFMIETLEHMHDWQLEETFATVYGALADGAVGQMVTLEGSTLRMRTPSS